MGDGDRVLDACGGYCDRVLETLPACYSDERECLDDCAFWTAVTLGGYCGCDEAVDGLFACDQSSDPASRVCGRLTQGIPPSYDCIDAYTGASVCGANVPPCLDYTVQLIEFTPSPGPRSTAGTTRRCETAWPGWR